MRLSQTIPFALILFAILILGASQQKLTVNFSSISYSSFKSFQTDSGQNYEAAELERQAGLSCAQ